MPHHVSQAGERSSLRPPALEAWVGEGQQCGEDWDQEWEKEGGRGKRRRRGGRGGDGRGGGPVTALEGRGMSGGLAGRWKAELRPESLAPQPRGRLPLPRAGKGVGQCP